MRFRVIPFWNGELRFHAYNRIIKEVVSLREENLESYVDDVTGHSI